jgi:hypothetical protein
MRRLGGLLALTAIAWLLSDSSAGQSAEWWYTGSWDNGRFLHFIDASTVKRPTAAYARFNALAYYTTPWIQTNTPTGEPSAVAYEKLISAFDCRDHSLHGQRFLFNADEQLFVIEPQDSFAFIESLLVDSEYAFVCLGERAGGSHHFRRIFEDPLTYSRKMSMDKSNIQRLGRPGA